MISRYLEENWTSYRGRLQRRDGKKETPGKGIEFRSRSDAEGCIVPATRRSGWLRAVSERQRRAV